MKSEHGGPSYYHGWVICTSVMAAISGGAALVWIVDPRPFTAGQIQRMALLLVCAGLFAFWAATIVDGLIDTVREARAERLAAPERERQLREAREAMEREARGEHLPQGLCGNRDPHEAHVYDSTSLGTFWCTADESQRLPYAAEQWRKERS